MVKKIKTCVFISGNGSNLQSILKSSRDYSFPIKVELIISNNLKAKGLKIARKYGIPFKFFPYIYQRKFERSCIYEIKKRKIKFICLAGFMKILSSNFITTFAHKIINIHPSLLPKFKGTQTHKKALMSKEKYSGCTVHFVTATVDSGKIISRKRVLIHKNDTEKSLKKKILYQEHRLYSQSIIGMFK